MFRVASSPRKGFQKSLETVLYCVTKWPKSCQRKRLSETLKYGLLAPFKDSFVIGMVTFDKSAEFANVFIEAEKQF